MWSPTVSLTSDWCNTDKRTIRCLLFMSPLMTFISPLMTCVTGLDYASLQIPNQERSEMLEGRLLFMGDWRGWKSGWPAVGLADEGLFLKSCAPKDSIQVFKHLSHKVLAASCAKALLSQALPILYLGHWESKCLWGSQGELLGLRPFCFNWQVQEEKSQLRPIH